MLSFLNILIGFAAVFALFSLFVTALTQFLRALFRIKNRYLIERLRRLFGELADPDRFVAALLTHPSLEGARGAALHRILTDPSKPGSDPEVRAAAEKVIGPPGAPSLPTLLMRPFSRAAWPFSKTSDLDKQTVKDVATSVYAQIGSLVDSPVTKEKAREAFACAPALLKSLEDSAAATPDATSFHGKLWALATVAFPEGQGKADPIKTYVAAFHDEAQASASDHFTFVMRVLSTSLAAVVVILFNLDALKVWTDLAAGDPARIDAFAKSVAALQPAGAAAPPSDDARKSLDDAAKSLALLSRAPITMCFCWKPLPWPDKAVKPEQMPDESESKCRTVLKPGQGLAGGFLSLFALSFGAPFWFEVLKSAIGLKSAFTDKGAGK